jgi:hypothetical protein
MMNSENRVLSEARARADAIARMDDAALFARYGMGWRGERAWAAQMLASAVHQPTPDDELDQQCYDVCRHCGHAIRTDECGIWRTMTGFNAECYGRAS